MQSHSQHPYPTNRLHRTINLGKFGSFPTNSLIHRPHHLTFDILDSPPSLSVVSTEEITRDLLGEELARAADEEGAENGNEEDGEGDEKGDLVMSGDDVGLDDVRNNRETVDDPNAQKLSWKEIEELKKRGGGQSGRVSNEINMEEFDGVNVR